MTPINVVDRTSTLEKIGASFRSRRGGPEQELVDEFLRRSIIRVPRGCRATIFREPRIESGFPDLVVVVWHVATAERWHPLRASLSTNDIRLMHYLSHTGPSRIAKLQALFCRELSKSIARLERAQIVRLVRDRWVAGPLSKLFAARHIVAIEAKIGKLRQAMDQAYINTWFASSSYVMLPHIQEDNPLLLEASSLGLHVYAAEQKVLDLRQGPIQRLPLSYASWQFNEWAWRAAQATPELR